MLVLVAVAWILFAAAIGWTVVHGLRRAPEPEIAPVRPVADPYHADEEATLMFPSSRLDGDEDTDEVTNRTPREALQEQLGVLAETTDEV